MGASPLLELGSLLLSLPISTISTISTISRPPKGWSRWGLSARSSRAHLDHLDHLAPPSQGGKCSPLRSAWGRKIGRSRVLLFLLAPTLRVGAEDRTLPRPPFFGRGLLAPTLPRGGASSDAPASILGLAGSASEPLAATADLSSLRSRLPPLVPTLQTAKREKVVFLRRFHAATFGCGQGRSPRPPRVRMPCLGRSSVPTSPVSSRSSPFAMPSCKLPPAFLCPAFDSPASFRRNAAILAAGAAALL